MTICGGGVLCHVMIVRLESYVIPVNTRMPEHSIGVSGSFITELTLRGIIPKTNAPGRPESRKSNSAQDS